MSFKPNSKGVSLPLSTGLILLLFTSTTAIHLTVIKNLRSVQQIEASARAQSLAEAGVEEALYTLSGHLAGFETAPLEAPPLNDAGRTDGISRWAILSHDQTDCPEALPATSICGSIGNNRKLTLGLFNDTGSAAEAPLIQTLRFTSFELTFEVPTELLTSHADAFVSGLVIDNDEDAWVTTIENGINEDGKYDLPQTCSVGDRSLSSRDNDCDGQEDEDSPENPVIYWKLSDGAGHTLTPQPGCLGETDEEKPIGSELCEKSFIMLGLDRLGVTLDLDDTGIDQAGNPVTLRAFLSGTLRAFLSGIEDGRALQMELLVVAPLEQVDSASQKKIPIPALNYSVNYTADGLIPDPLFMIQSDGYYRDFKQSITTTITPKTSVPLTDFTLIQQE